MAYKYFKQMLSYDGGVNKYLLVKADGLVLEPTQESNVIYIYVYYT